MAAYPILYRAVLRRQIHSLRDSTRHQQQRRWQSSKPGADGSKGIPTPNMIPTVDLSFWHRLGPLTRAVQSYGRAQRKRPWVTQLCTSLTIYFCADLAAQRIGGKGFDAERTFRSVTIGGIASIPSYEWFMWLSRHFNYPSRILSIAIKITVNQLLLTPIFNLYFFSMQAFMAGDNLVETWERIKRTVPISLINSAKLWPAVTAINFAFVPIEYRSIFAGTINIGWQTYMTWLNRQAEEAEAISRPSGRIPPSGMDMATS